MTKLPAPRLDSACRNGIALLTDEALFEACGVRIAFTGRYGGVSEEPYGTLNLAGHVGDDPRHVAQNRRAVLDAIGANGEPLIVANQVHGTRIAHIATMVDVGRVASEALEGADGIQVDVDGIAAMIGSADCLSLALVAPSGHFTAVHAGWRGAVAHIASAAVELLASDGEDPSTFNAYLGPRIGPECFEVSEETASQFVAEFGDSVAPDSRHVDLAGAVMLDLVEAGMDRNRIADCEICTVCHSEEYYSYRASGGTCGRHAVAVYRARSDRS